MLVLFGCQEDDEIVPETRLFRPVLNEDLFSLENTIVVNLANMKSAVSYTIEVSRDTFQTIEYTIQTDTNYVVIDEALVGEQLFWDALYQVRSTAHADDSQFDSRPSDLGSVRTQRFPTVLNVPAPWDVTDMAARITWTVAGAPVTGIKVFSANDLRLQTPLMEFEVDAAGQEAGESFIDGLDPATEYQMAIYSEDRLRGWVGYTTLAADIDPAAPGVIDVRDNPSPMAVSDAVATAPDGATILVKRGVTYNFPEDNLNKSVTIRGAYGFGEQKAMLFTTGNWNIDDGSTIGHIRFIDLELRGEDMGGDYVFNPNRDNVAVGEVLFENCHITNFRGIFRLRGTTSINDFKIIDSRIDSIGNYGLLTCDTNPASEGSSKTAHVNNILFQNSTFSEVEVGIQSRNNSESLVIEGCTFYNFPATGNRFLRFRGGDGNNNVMNGIEIVDSIFGHSWDENDEGNYGGVRNEGLGGTNFTIINTYSTVNFAFNDGSELPNFPVGNYGKSAEDLWMNPVANNFNIKDKSFVGRFSAGDPRWRDRI